MLSSSISCICRSRSMWRQKRRAAGGVHNPTAGSDSPGQNGHLLEMCPFCPDMPLLVRTCPPLVRFVRLPYPHPRRVHSDDLVAEQLLLGAAKRARCRLFLGSAVTVAELLAPLLFAYSAAPMQQRAGCRQLYPAISDGL